MAHVVRREQASADAAGHTAGDEGVVGVGGGDSDGVDGAGGAGGARADGGGGKREGGKRGGGASRTLPRFVCLVGLPAAGKSTFAQALAASDSAWVRMSDGRGGKGWGLAWGLGLGCGVGVRVGAEARSGG